MKIPVQYFLSFFAILAYLLSSASSCKGMEYMGCRFSPENWASSNSRECQLYDLVAFHFYKGITINEVIELLGPVLGKNDDFPELKTSGTVMVPGFDTPVLCQLPEHSYTNALRFGKCPAFQSISYFLYNDASGPVNIIFLFDENGIYCRFYIRKPI